MVAPCILSRHFVGHFPPRSVLLVANEHADHSVVCVFKYLLVPLFDCPETFQACHVVNEEGADASSEEKRSERVEFFLPEGVPDVRLHPIVTPFDIDRWHGEDLDHARRRLSFFKFIEDASIGKRSFAYAAIANQDYFVVLLTRPVAGHAPGHEGGGSNWFGSACVVGRIFFIASAKLRVLVPW